MTTIVEEISREALVALSNQYRSVAHAVMELVDNPFDYRRGRHLSVDITIDKTKDLVQVHDHGGEGMDDKGLQEWIRWGTGRQHTAGDIGQWHVGGKLAAMYLAEGVLIECSRAGSEEVWRFRDPHWGSRTTLYRGTARLLDNKNSSRSGFTRVLLRGLKPHRYEIGILTANLSNTYRTLLQNGECTIRVNEGPVAPLDIAVSCVYDPVEIPRTNCGAGVTVSGRVWVTDRDRFPGGRGIGIRAGIRTVFNGRLVTDGEEFGHYLAGRGSLQRLVGEIHLGHMLPNTTKNDWDRDSPEWSAVHAFMYEQMRPVVAFLNQLSEARPVSREQRKTAERVRRRVEDALKKLRDSGSLMPGLLGGTADAPGGRRPPSPPEGREPRPTDETQPPRVTRKRTPPPEDAVGRLVRRYSGGVPPIVFDALGRTPRTDWRVTDGRREIVINTDFPMYKSLGLDEDYLLEAVMLHLLTENEDELLYDDARQRLEEVIWIASD